MCIQNLAAKEYGNIVHVFSNVHTSTSVVKQVTFSCFFSLSDACNPSWRSTRDGRTYLAFVYSIVAYIFTATLICVHVYYNRSEELQLYFYVMTMFSLTM